MSYGLWLLLMGFFFFSGERGDAWTHSLTLEPEGSFHLSWSPRKEEVLMEMSVRTKGYSALGFSTNGGMRGSDILLAWVDEGGEPHLVDSHALGNQAPLPDLSQDYTLIHGYENETHTVIRFSRPWDTCDSKGDHKLGSDTVRLIWAYGESDPDIDGVPLYHGHSRRGTRSVYLQELPFTKFSPVDQGARTWDLLGRNVILPSDDHTHYWCQIFRAPKLKQKHHMIGFEPIIEPGHEAFVHHMVLYECHVHEGSSETWFEEHVGGEGAACYSPNMPPEWSFCLASNAWAWAIGSEGENLPEHAGMPLGEEYGGASYFMLEVHYDNPAQKPIVDNSGIRIFYTPHLRQYDTGMLLIGTEVNFLQLIPPRQKAFTSLGRCVSRCTKEGLPSDGVKLLSGLLHSHIAGRKMRVRHVRDGKELPIVLEDDSYDFNYQVSRIPKRETTVLPGDELLLECQYDTRNRSTPTFGGLSTREEMCIAFILYYPRSSLADCRSLPTLETVMSALNVQSIYGSAFEKLVGFLKDIGSIGDDHLNQLLDTLYRETGSSFFKKKEVTSRKKVSFLSEEELLKKPFYTVEKPVSPFQEHTNNYRTLLPEMLMKVRIRNPVHLRNKTIGDHFYSMNWTDPAVWKTFMKVLYFGDHSSLCLAHGRSPIIPYESQPFPEISETASNDRENVCSTKAEGSSFEDNNNFLLTKDFYEFLRKTSGASLIGSKSFTLGIAGVIVLIVRSSLP